VLAPLACGGDAVYRADRFAGEEAIRERAASFWSAEGIGGLAAVSGRDAAILGFGVELSGAIPEPGVLPSPLGTTAPSIFELEPEVRHALPRLLHDLFVEELEAIGFRVTPLAEVVALPPLARLREEMGNRRVATDGPGGTGGQRFRADVLTVDGLLPVRSGAFATSQVQRGQAEVLVESGLDVALLVRMRVRIDADGRLQLLDGSTIRVTAGARRSPDGGEAWSTVRGMLVSTQAMSHPAALASRREDVATGRTILTIDPDALVDALRESFPTYVRLALHRLEAGSTAGASDRP